MNQFTKKKENKSSKPESSKATSVSKHGNLSLPFTQNNVFFFYIIFELFLRERGPTTYEF